MIDSKNGVIGLAIGDAMGVPLEFCIREKLQKNITTEMLGYGSHNVPKGTWSDYNSAIIKVINLGNDTDTIGACVGGLAGIYYGLEDVNENWKSNLQKFDYIVELCEKFNGVLND